MKNHIYLLISASFDYKWFVLNHYQILMNLQLNFGIIRLVVKEFIVAINI